MTLLVLCWRMQLKYCSFAQHDVQYRCCGNGNRIFPKWKTRFVRFRQCGFFFATDGKFQPSSRLSGWIFSSDFFPSFLSFIYLLLIILFLKGFRNLPTTLSAVCVCRAQGFNVTRSSVSRTLLHYPACISALSTVRSYWSHCGNVKWLFVTYKFNFYKVH